LKPTIPEIQTKHIIDVNWADRWQVYQRLQDLDIPCSCQTNEPLKVEINNPTAAIQFWSVMRQLRTSRQEQIGYLKLCWQKRVK
jgi:hypothetical protein